MSQNGTADPARRARGWHGLLPWLITLVCFTYLYFQIEAQAGRQEPPLSAVGLLGSVFAEVDWVRWLALMIPYSAFFFLVDSLVVWRIINWFNAKVPYTDILPIRASAYIISILNEQVGKGAMAIYLHRRDGVPGWQVGSSMLFIMFCEFYYLLSWATLGALLQWDKLPPVLQNIPVVALIAAVFLVAWLLFWSGMFAPGVALRDRQILRSFKKARFTNYLAIVLMLSPALLAAVVVYKESLALFGQETTYLEMLGYLPVVFFGASIPGPFRAVAVAMWPLLYPDRAAEMSAFGLVQHNFFIFFNAAIGLLFLRRANRDLFSESQSSSSSGQPKRS